MKPIIALAFCLALISFAPTGGAAAQDQPTAEQLAKAEAHKAKMVALRDGMHPQHGVIQLPKAKAVLTLGQGYYFLDETDMRKVLVEAWGNPPQNAQGVLGMIFQEGTTFLDRDAWGATVEFVETHYVKDADAKTADYGKVLGDMKSGEEEENKLRAKDGYEAVHLVGWAQPPSYDAARHDLIWARDIQFGDEADHTLNYDVRHLGRYGVLSINMISAMSSLEKIRPAAVALAQTADFTEGARYADYQKGDKTAAYGLAGLVAAGAGLAVAQKAGALAVILLVLKKGAVVFIAGFAAIGAWFRRRFGAKKPPEDPPGGGNIVE